MNSLLFIAIVLFAPQIILAYPGQYIPKSFYKVDNNGNAYDKVNFEEMFPQLRSKRDTYDSSNNIPFYFGPENFFPENFFKDFNNLFRQNVLNPVAGLAAKAQSIPDGNYDTGNTKARTGTLNGVDGVQISSRSSGPNGAFSFSSTSVDSNGNARYSGKTHHY